MHFALIVLTSALAAANPTSNVPVGTGEVPCLMASAIAEQNPTSTASPQNRLDKDLDQLLAILVTIRQAEYRLHGAEQQLIRTYEVDPAGYQNAAADILAFAQQLKTMMRRLDKTPRIMPLLPTGCDEGTCPGLDGLCHPC